MAVMKFFILFVFILKLGLSHQKHIGILHDADKAERKLRTIEEVFPVQVIPDHNNDRNISRDEFLDYMTKSLSVSENQNLLRFYPQKDTNGDGVLDREEISLIFDTLDFNGDGLLNALDDETNTMVHIPYQWRQPIIVT